MNYLEKVLELARTIDTTKPGTHHIMVRHDEWCQVFYGGPCICNPTVELTKPPKGFGGENETDI